MEEAKQAENFLAAIEAILFIYGESMTLKKIAKIISKNPIFKDVDAGKIKIGLKELENKYSSGDRGLRLIFSGSPAEEEVQLVTKPDFSSLLEDFIKEEFKESLSPASLEALAIIIYLGPLSRAKLDYFRGVNSSFILRSLLIRGLIDRYPDPQRNNVYLYQSSFDLLKYLGMGRVEELPEYERFRDLSRKAFENGAEELKEEPKQKQNQENN